MLSNPSLSIGEVARLKSGALAREFRVEHLTSELLRILRYVGDDWFDRQTGSGPWFDTDITDDGSPFELSVALEGAQPELRVLAEAQEAPFDLHSNWRAGLRATERLAHDYALDLERFHRVKELFAPGPDASGRFAIWHAAAVAEGRAPLLKVYFNPAARGGHRASATVETALARLGMSEAWAFLVNKLEREPSARLAFFSLDLRAGEQARVKVYIAYPNANASTVDEGLLGSAEYTAGDATRFIRRVTGQAGPFDERPLLVCHAFCSGQAGSHATLHVPVRCYVQDDAAVLDACAAQLGPQREAAVRALSAMAGRALGDQAGLITYASVRSTAGSQRLTLYLAPELYASRSHAVTTRPVPHNSYPAPHNSYVAPRGHGLGSPTALTMLTVQDAIHRARLLLQQHPFIQRLEHGADIGQLQSMTRAMTFFVMCFQDVLRLARMVISDPMLRSIAEVHEREDRGHEQWFLHDAQRLDSACDLRTVFSTEFDTVRDVSYSLIAEVLSAQDDRQRLAVVLCLEAAGGEFFHRVISRLERLGADQGLRYFARGHQHVEESHEVFESDTQLTLASIPAPADVLALVLQSVERSFVAMAQLADALERVMRDAERTRSVA